MVEELLREIGFSDKEIKVYLAALKLGMQPASVLAKHLKMNRVTTYVICKKLIEKGVANALTRNNIQYFSVEQPESLVRYSERQQQDWKRRTLSLEKHLPEFNTYFRHISSLPKVRFYDGVEGIKTVYEDTLTQGKSIRAFLTVDTIPKELKDFLIEDYTPRLVEREIRSQIIVADSPRARRYVKHDERYLRESVIVQPQDFPFETEIAMYGKDRVAFISFKEGDLTGVIIENEAIHRTLSGIFQLLFRV
ncbi:MAG: Sugar-specific transcriptional regulator TrmB family [uncultured bacterium]|nr:MAG: Sugar-specific transcriptional regulator TrmB family [uncultured bacterium]KKT75469.1 MAG: Transcriptional regulator, TrmB [Candidatus Peregrinibacteria bacterium GW2011_GWA2_44_7]